MNLFPEQPIVTTHWADQDITANKHQQNPASVKAHEVVQLTKRQVCSKVYEYIVAQRDRGATSKETSRALNMPLQTVSARMSDLLALEMIEETDMPRREGCGVRKAKCWL